MKVLRLALSIGMTFCVPAYTSVATAEEHLDEFTKALIGGKPKVNVRYRYEGVDDDANTLKKAKASTIRTRLGYGTGDFHGFSVYGEMEDIREVGKKKYTDGPGPVDDGDGEYDTVADPQETELNQAYLQFKHAYETSSLMIRHGRQRQKWDNDRFIGNVGWRQNEQTYDATHVQVESKKYGLRAMYSHQTNVNRIFGDQADTAGDFNVTNDNFNVNYSGLKYLDATGYYYLWEGDESVNLLFGEDDSRKTAGLRLKGKFPVSDMLTVLGTAEYASQGDYKDADDFSSLNYTLFEAGASFKPSANFAPITVKAGIETLEGDVDDGESFITPFATLHAFQGWADVFLASGISGLYGGEAAGIEDTYFSIGTKMLGTKLLAVYHDYEPDDSDSSFDEYGTEINLLAAKKFAKHYTVGVKYADFNAKDDFRGDEDKSVFWLWGQINF